MTKIVVGYHIIVEMYGSPLVRRTAKELEHILASCAKEAGLSIVGTTHHQFHPEGATVAILLSESHITAHTWPEYGYLSLDIYTCGTSAEESAAHAKKALDVILRVFEPTGYMATGFFRGWDHSWKFPEFEFHETFCVPGCKPPREVKETKRVAGIKRRPEIIGIRI